MKSRIARIDLYVAAGIAALAGVDAGNFELNPSMKAEAGKQSTIYFHRGGRAASCIELPAIP